MRAELSRGAQKVTFHIFLAYYVKHTKTNTNTNLRAKRRKRTFHNATVIKKIQFDPTTAKFDRHVPNKFHIRNEHNYGNNSD